MRGMGTTTLPVWSSLAVVCAHPDDESFGLGAVLSRFAEAGCRLGLLCFTHGEASTLHDAAGELHAVRADELAAASAVLGVDPVRLLDYPDGGLGAHDIDELADHVIGLCSATAAAGMLVFDECGVTGHPDHRTATAAAARAADELVLPVLAWAIPSEVARFLNDGFGTRFVGRSEDELDMAITVDRARQLAAIRCHQSQSVDNPVLWRRLELLGAIEYLRFLRPSTG
jgi:N-acetylglucosamine malate deacetylase 2